MKFRKYRKLLKSDKEIAQRQKTKDILDIVIMLQLPLRKCRKGSNCIHFTQYLQEICYLLPKFYMQTTYFK